MDDRLKQEYEKFIREEELRAEAEEKARKLKRDKTLFGSFVLLLFAVPTILSAVLFLRVIGLEKTVAALYDELYGTHTQETLGSVNDPSENTVNTISLNIISEEDEAVAGDEEEVIECSVDPYEGYIKVCLTFDDGPSENTDEILDILADYGVKATFFVNEKEGFDDEYMRIVEEGHTIGMHSATHVYRDVYASLDAFAADLYSIQDFIYGKTGVMPVYYRFPGGSSNKVSAVPMEDCIRYLEAKGIIYYDWNIASNDATPGGISTTDIVSNVLNPIYAGEESEYVILMHDAADKDTTVEALPIIIETLADMENVVIVPIDENVIPVHQMEEN